MSKFDSIVQELEQLIEVWEPILSSLSEDTISQNRNSQNRTIKQIVGHMIDSASNNTHRIIHLQYQKSPISFPDYANLGLNDKWIAIQNYQDEPWDRLVNLWKYIHLHICHIIRQVDVSKLNAIWISAKEDEITLESMIVDFPRHFDLHLAEIEELTN